MKPDMRKSDLDKLQGFQVGDSVKYRFVVVRNNGDNGYETTPPTAKIVEISSNGGATQASACKAAS
jgi:hypothetical protein